MVTLIDTHRIEAILAHDGARVCTDEYIMLLARLATEKLKLSRDRFETLRKAIAQSFGLPLESSPALLTA